MSDGYGQIRTTLNNNNPLDSTQIDKIENLLRTCNNPNKKIKNAVKFLRKTNGQWYQKSPTPDAKKTTKKALLDLLNQCSTQARSTKNNKAETKKGYQPYYKFHPIYGNLRY